MNQDSLCPPSIFLGRKCGCEKVGDCGVIGQSCFRGEGGCTNPCQGHGIQSEKCSCSYSNEEKAHTVLVAKNEVCGNYILAHCPNGCFHCSNKPECYGHQCRDTNNQLICFPGYYFTDERKCEICPKNCLSCSYEHSFNRKQPGHVQCQHCQLKYVAVQNQCVEIDSASRNDIFSDYYLQNCQLGFSCVNFAGQCKKCLINGCSLCSTNTAHCEACFAGAVQEDGSCSTCKGNCSCQRDFFANDAAINCSECDLADTTKGGCKTCISGFKMDNLANCIILNSSNDTRGKKLVKLTIIICIVLTLALFVSGMCYLIIIRCNDIKKQQQQFHGWIIAKPVSLTV